MKTTVVEVKEHEVKVVEQFGQLTTDVTRRKTMSHTATFSMCVDSAQEVDDSDEKAWREVKMAYIIPKGRGVGIETFYLCTWFHSPYSLVCKHSCVLRQY